MKKYICAALAVVLMAAMFVGCCRRNVSDQPGGMITEATEQRPAATNPMPTMTEPATSHATAPTATHGATEPTQGTTHGSTGPMTGSTEGTHETGGARSGIMPDSRS